MHLICPSAYPGSYEKIYCWYAIKYKMYLNLTGPPTCTMTYMQSNIVIKLDICLTVGFVN